MPIRASRSQTCRFVISDPKTNGWESSRPVTIKAYILSCPDRQQLRLQTLVNLRSTDWNEEPEIEIDQTTCERRQERQERTALCLLQRAVDEGSEYILFLEDDLDFNLHLRRNLQSWYPLAKTPSRLHFFASLYNPNIRSLAQSPPHAYFVADPNAVYGSQAFLLSLITARYITEHWGDVVGMQDIKMSRLAARQCPLYYHTPSLVQHVGVESAWGGGFHSAADFSRDWESPHGI
jgi:hypothetical protein